MIFNVSEIAQILHVDRNTVKLMSFRFFEYLNKNANPVKGKPRIFNIDDLRVLAYVSIYWEDEPDIENIKIGLNTNRHFEHPLIDELITANTPIFIDPPEEVNEDWKHGIVFGGLSQIGDIMFLATSYKLAGDRLIDVAINNQEAFQLYCPIIYNYRHAVELYLKSAIGKHKQSHDLTYLLDKLKQKLKKDFNSEIPSWFESIVKSFSEFDPTSTTFRYGGGQNNDEVFVDFNQLKTVMQWIADSFKNINQTENKFG